MGGTRVSKHRWQRQSSPKTHSAMFSSPLFIKTHGSFESLLHQVSQRLHYQRSDGNEGSDQ